MNYHFGDKRRPYVEAVKRAHLNRAKQYPLPAWPSGAPANERLYDFVLTLLKRMASPTARWETELMLREIARPSDACRELVRGSIRPRWTSQRVAPDRYRWSQ